jgi:predicted RNA-binding protein
MLSGVSLVWGMGGEVVAEDIIAVQKQEAV